MPPRKRLGQLLTELGVIDDHQLQSALGHQRQWGGKLGAILVQKGFCGEEQLVSALAQHLNMERVKLSETKIDPRAVKFVSKQIAEKLHVIPYQVTGAGRSEVISIAMSDPTDLSAVDQLAFHTGKRIKPLLASDGEIVSAIQASYGVVEEKKEATDKVARPPGSPAAQAGAPAAGFPKRIEPQAPAAAAAPAPRPSPFAPPTPAPPVKPVAAPQKAAEAPAAAPAAPVPVELPEDDSDDLGLEPIAAHSQFGDVVAGAEEVAGNGNAGDTIEGLVSASLAHEGAEQARAAASQTGAADDAAPPAQSWGEPAREVLADAAASVEAGWPGLESAAPADQGWGTPLKTDEASWATAQPAAEVPSAWPASPVGDGWSMEEPSTNAGWSTAEGEQAWTPEGGAAPEQEAPSEALPTDAILGAVQEFREDAEESGGGGWDAEEPAAAASPADAGELSDPLVAVEPQAPAGFEPHDAGVPEPRLDPAAEPREEASAESATDLPAPEQELFAAPGIDAVPEPQEDASSGAGVEASPESREELFAAAGIDDAAEPSPDAEAELSLDITDDSSARVGDPDTEPIPPPAYAVAAEGHEAEAPDAWGAIDDPLAAEASPEAAAFEAIQAAAAGEGLSSEELANPLASEPINAPDAEPPVADFTNFETAAAELPPGEPEAPRWQPDGDASDPSAEAPPSGTTERFAHKEPGWIGEALQGATPLSPADLGTLASIGIAPGDGVGALRLLAALVRILNRGQLIEPDDLRAEIRESQEAAAAVQSPNGAESEGSSPASAEPPGPPAEP